MNSFGTNCVLNDNKDLNPYDLYMQYHPDVMLQASCNLGESKLNLYWLIVLTSSSGTNYVPNEHEDFDKYDPYAIPSEIMSY